MKIGLITGCGGLIGSESVRFFTDKGFDIVGIDNDMRSYFFGEAATTQWCINDLKHETDRFTHWHADIRDHQKMEQIFQEYNSDIKVVVHTAAQPSHDWAASEPMTDFSINATGTITLLELTRKYCPQAVFIFTSTNKVYGDTPNHLPLIETDSRWELDKSHKYALTGIDESMSIDQNKHSLFGASKLSADIIVQEYGRYFGMKTVALRGGCLTGPCHSGAQLHGFLSYLMKCAVAKEHYMVFGYNGKQVRDIIHSYDLVNMMWHYYLSPRCGEVYNVGGGTFSNCSMLEAISACERITGNKLKWTYADEHRNGDHIWWISDVSKFKRHYPEWDYRYGLEEIYQSIYDGLSIRQRSK